MAGLGSKVISALIAIPVQSFISKKMEASWRGATGTEPPSSKRHKEQLKAKKKALKDGEEPPAVDEPGVVDALMWAALTAMSVIAVRVIAERSAEEVSRWVTGKNPPTEKRGAVHGASDAGETAGLTMNKKVLK